MTGYSGNYRRAGGSGHGYGRDDDQRYSRSRYASEADEASRSAFSQGASSTPSGYQSLSSQANAASHRAHYERHVRASSTANDQYAHFARQQRDADIDGLASRGPGVDYKGGSHTRTFDARSYDASTYSRAASRYHSQSRSKSTGKKVLISVLCVLACALIVGIGAFALWYSGIANNLKGDQSISNTTAAVANEPYYVLLLGGDSRNNSTEDNRSDSIMVARVDEQEKQVSLISVPRDLRVNMDEHGYQKINSAIEYGGYDYAIEIINNVLDIKINYYAFIYFDGFEELVDKLGGVTVDVPEGTYYDGVWVPAGEDVEINGEEALVLARCRHGYPPDQGAYAMGDYQRTLNQRNLIKAIGKKVLASDVTALPDLISGLSECVETNMGVDRIVSLATNLKGMDLDDLDAEQLPIAAATIDGAWTAVMYRDVFEAMDENFVEGRELMDGIEGFNRETNDDNIGTDYIDGPVYSYTMYEEHYGSFKSLSSGSSSTSSSTSTYGSSDAED